MHEKNALNLNVFVALLLLPNVVVSGYGRYSGTAYPPCNNTTPVYPALITGKCEDMNPTISLNLSGIDFRTIPDNFIESPHVNCLTLRRDNIYTISKQAFKNVSNLLFLDLSENSLNRNGILNFSLIVNLKTLVLDNVLQSFFHSDKIPTFSPIPNLEHFYMRNNRIGLLRKIFRYIAPKLTHLYLSENQLESTAFFKNLPQTLISLHLGNNRIRNIQEPLPTNLTELNLNGNRIESICHRYCTGASLLLRGAEKLEKLSLSENRITEIMVNAFEEVTNLLSLDISRNNIKTIENGTFSILTKLQNLSISDNALTSIPNLHPLSSIKLLNLNSNNIALIDSDVLCNISSLNTLLLANNRIQIIDDRFFACLGSVEILNLSNNQLRSLSAPQMTSWSALRKIYVANNLFEDFNDLSLINMKNLTDVYIDRNRIMSLNTATILSFPRNVSVHFSTACTEV